MKQEKKGGRERKRTGGGVELKGKEKEGRQENERLGGRGGGLTR